MLRAPPAVTVIPPTRCNPKQRQRNKNNKQQQRQRWQNKSTKQQRRRWLFAAWLITRLATLRCCSSLLSLFRFAHMHTYASTCVCALVVCRCVLCLGHGWTGAAAATARCIVAASCFHHIVFTPFIHWLSCANAFSACAPLSLALLRKTQSNKNKNSTYSLPLWLLNTNTLSVSLSFSLFLSVTCCALLLLFLLRLQILRSFCCQCCQIIFVVSYKDRRKKGEQTCKG